jgi:hypothetical protein
MDIVQNCDSYTVGNIPLSQSYKSCQLKLSKYGFTQISHTECLKLILSYFLVP